MDIKEIMTKAHKTSCQKGWWDDHDGMTEAQQAADVVVKLALVTCEVAEAIEEVRKVNDTIQMGFDLTDIYYVDHSDVSNEFEVYAIDMKDSGDLTVERYNKPEGLTVELADAIIRICDLAAKKNLPLARAIEEKLTYNETRSYRHGNKVL